MKAKTKKKIRHTLTKKKILKRKHSHHLLRSAYIIVATITTGSLAFAIATTKPTVNIQIAPRNTTRITTIKPGTAASGEPDQVGQGSWYALGLPEPDALTCASTTFPRGTYLQVTDRRTSKSVTCLVNDYGPEAWTGRVIDLSRGSFRVIDDLGSGTAPVEIRVVPPPPTSLNLPVLSNFAQFIGYNLCHQQHTAQFCDSNRQQR